MMLCFSSTFGRCHGWCFRDRADTKHRSNITESGKGKRLLAMTRLAAVVILKVNDAPQHCGCLLRL